MFTLQLHLWTPAFAGGSTPRTVDPITPIRPPSIRGVLRWWFRAAASAVLLPAEGERAREGMLAALRRAEAEIFGDTTRRSRLAVLPPRGGTVVRVLPEQHSWAGLRYLGYGLFEQTTAQAVITRREAHPAPPSIPSEDPIELRLQLRPTGPGDHVTESHRRLVEATVWLWLHFGGVGARSRRGWGSLGLEGDDNGLFSAIRPVKVDAIRQLVDALNDGLDQVTAIFREHLPRLLGAPLLRDGTAPHPAIRSIDGIETATVLPGEHATPIQALDAAGRLFLGFRSTLARRRFGMAPLPDYHSVKTSLQVNKAAVRVERAAFGLPLPFYFRSLGGAQTRFVPRERGKKHDRLASPLLFRVHRLGAGKQARYVTVLVNLADRVKPMGELDLLQTSDGRGPEGPVDHAPDGAILKSFVSWAIQEARRARGGK